MFHGKKAVVDMMMEFVIAVVVLLIVWMVIKVALALPVGFGKQGVAPTGVFQSAEYSGACDYWLTGFLRADSPEGISYADLLAYAAASPKYSELFQKDTKYYFTNVYQKRNPNLPRWSVKAETSGFISVLSVASTERPLAVKCFQKIASTKGPLTVTLGVDY